LPNNASSVRGLSIAAFQSRSHHALFRAEYTIVRSLPDDTVLAVLARPSLRCHARSPAAAFITGVRRRTPISFSSTTTYGAPPHGYISSPPSTTASSTLSPTSPISTANTTPISALHGRLLAFLASSPTASPVLSGTGAPLVSWGHTLGRFFSRSAPAASALAASVF
jgi:hypothetical protein